MTTKKKPQHRVRNWRDYNAALVRRGSLNLSIEQRSLEAWLDHERPARRGRRRTYTDAPITCSLLLRGFYRLQLRATEGLVSPVLRLLGAELPAPDYSTVSRRAASSGSSPRSPAPPGRSRSISP